KQQRNIAITHRANGFQLFVVDRATFFNELAQARGNFIGFPTAALISGVIRAFVDFLVDEQEFQGWDVRGRSLAFGLHEIFEFDLILKGEAVGVAREELAEQMIETVYKRAMRTE